MPSESMKVIITPRDTYLAAQEKQQKLLGGAIKSIEIDCPVCSQTCFLTKGGKAYADSTQAKGVEVEFVCFACAKDLFKKDPDKFFEGMEDKHKKLLTLMFRLDDRAKETERPNLRKVDEDC